MIIYIITQPKDKEDSITHLNNLEGLLPKWTSMPRVTSKMINGIEMKSFIIIQKD
jgi:hypothetical protein